MTPADDPSELLADLRAHVDAASDEVNQALGELTATRALADEMETIVDVLLGLDGATVLVIDDDRRVRGLSRHASSALDGVAVGKPLSSAVPDDLFDQVVAHLDTKPRGPRPLACDGADVYPLPGGGAVLVLADG